MELKLNRESNAELLRLISMFMIVLHHFVYHVVYISDMQTQSITPTWDYDVVWYTHCLYFIGVNCFILISGYFSIRPTIRGFLNLYITYAFYGFFVGLYTLQSLDYSVTHSIVHVVEYTLSPFSNVGLWFLTCYLVLYCISPLINKGCEHLSRKTLLYLILVLTFLNVYMGDIKGISFVNAQGFCVAQFVYMYLIGQYIKMYVEVGKQNRTKYILAYLICALLWAGERWITENNECRLLDWMMWYEFSYANIFVVGASISFFMYVMSFKIQSKVINWLAASCLSLYIIQDFVYTSHFSMHNFREWTWTLEPSLRILSVFAVAITVWFLPLILDKLRMFITSPILNISDRYCQKIKSYMIHRNA